MVCLVGCKKWRMENENSPLFDVVDKRDDGKGE